MQRLKSEALGFSFVCLSCIVCVCVDSRMFAHILLLITVVSCMFFLVWESLPYRSLVTDKINFAYDYVIGMYCYYTAR